jgi:hypothetical protein
MNPTLNGHQPQQQTIGQAPPPSQVARTKTRASGATRRGKGWLGLLFDNKISLPEFAIVLTVGYAVSLAIDLLTLRGALAGSTVTRANLYVFLFASIVVALMLSYLITNIRDGKFPVWTASLTSFAIGLGCQPYLTEWVLMVMGVK